MIKVTEDDLKKIINKQMEINGYDVKYHDLLTNKEWYHHYTTTPEKEKEWKEYLKNFYKNRYPKGVIEKGVGEIILTFGLRTIYNKTDNTK